LVEYFLGLVTSVRPFSNIREIEMTEQKAKPKLIACIIVLAIPALLLINGFMPHSDSSSKDTPSPEPTQALGGYCLSVMGYLDNAVQVMAGAGTTTTEADILPVLKEEGDKLYRGFDTTMVDTAANVALLNNSGNDLLRIRVDIINGDDTSPDTKLFVSRYRKIKKMCASETN
jgi:hypothetical protein